jgi:hypothetical protein
MTGDNSASPFHTMQPSTPSIESPFFRQIFNAPSIDKETRSIALELSSNGNAVLDFPDAKFDAMAEAINTKFRDQFDIEHWKTVGRAAALACLREQPTIKLDVLISLATGPVQMGYCRSRPFRHPSDELADQLSRMAGRKNRPAPVRAALEPRSCLVVQGTLLCSL